MRCCAARRRWQKKKPLRLIKASQRRKHMLFDVPVVGPGTIDTMKETNTTTLAIDAGRTLMIDREEIITQADAAKISIIASPPLE